MDGWKGTEIVLDCGDVMFLFMGCFCCLIEKEFMVLRDWWILDYNPPSSFKDTLGHFGLWI